MKRRSLPQWLLVVAIVTCLLLPGPALSQNGIDDTPGSFEVLTNGEETVDLSRSIVTIRTIGVGTGSYFRCDSETFEIREGPFTTQGSGFVVRPNYIVTAAHVVFPSEVMLTAPNDDLFSGVSITRPIIQERTKLIFVGRDWDRIYSDIQAEIVYIDHTNDIALLHYSGNYFIPLPYEMMAVSYRDPFFGLERSILEKGDAVSLWVRETEKWCQVNGYRWELNSGEIISSEPALPPGCEGSLASLRPNSIPMTVQLYPGCSGSPVFVFCDGTPHIIGVASSYVSSLPPHINPFGLPTKDDYFYAVKIDPVIEVVKAFTNNH